MKKYTIDDGDYYIEIPDDITKQIIIDKLEKYYVWSLTLGVFIVGFLLGVVVS